MNARQTNLCLQSCIVTEKDLVHKEPNSLSLTSGKWYLIINAFCFAGAALMCLSKALYTINDSGISTAILNPVDSP